MWVDYIFFICSYYDAIVNFVVYGFVMLREFGFKEDIDVLFPPSHGYYSCGLHVWFPPSCGYHSCGFHPAVVCTFCGLHVWFPQSCGLHPVMVTTLLLFSPSCGLHLVMVTKLCYYVMPMLRSKLKKLWAIEYFWVLLHVLITIFYDLCSVTFMSSVHVSSCVICPYRKYD